MFVCYVVISGGKPTSTYAEIMHVNYNPKNDEIYAVEIQEIHPNEDGIGRGTIFKEFFKEDVYKSESNIITKWEFCTRKELPATGIRKFFKNIGAGLSYILDFYSFENSVA